MFGITAKATPLPSERDQNFYLETSDGKAYVLKIANAKESRTVLEFQNQAMAHVSDNKHKAFKSITPCPAVCTTPEGKSIVEIQGENGLKHFVRLLTFLPGKPMAKVNPHDHTLLHSSGRFFGKINVLLKDFDHPGAHREFHWDVAGSSTIINGLIHYIEDDKKASLVKTLLKQFQGKTEPLLGTLGKSVIYNGGNDYNVLVAPKENFRNKVSGVIDFGDMVYSCTICDLAVVCAYVMLDKKDPLAAASTIIAGFHSTFALTEDEISALFDLICMRLCISVCHSAHQAMLQPDNAYLKISEQPAWDLLFNLIKISPDFARFCFRDACGLSPVPTSDRLLSWLGKNRADFTPITDIDLETEPICVFDLGKVQ
ncbi:MAG: phosphotransferase [Deltaproteobacteria bacterium]|nr:phosphotransferase [Deltaproteobacteria bacterium]